MLQAMGTEICARFWAVRRVKQSEILVTRGVDQPGSSVAQKGTWACEQRGRQIYCKNSLSLHSNHYRLAGHVKECRYGSWHAFDLVWVAN